MTDSAIPKAIGLIKCPLLGKFSLLVFSRQLVVGLPKYMIVWWAVVVLVLLSYLGCMTSNFVTCVPPTKYWSVSMYPKVSITNFKTNSFHSRMLRPL
jgi:hypothetical protein